MVYENKEGLCCSSRRLIGHQEAAALSGVLCRGLTARVANCAMIWRGRLCQLRGVS
jgi:hypothetical protein